MIQDPNNRDTYTRERLAEALAEARESGLPPPLVQATQMEFANAYYLYLSVHGEASRRKIADYQKQRALEYISMQSSDEECA